MAEPLPPAGPPRWSAWLQAAGAVWLYYLLVAVCIAVPPFVVPALGFNLSFREGTAVTLGCTLVAEAIALGVLAAWLRRRRLTFAAIGWRRPTTTPALAIAVVLAVAYTAFTFLLPEVRSVASEATLFRVWGAAVSAFAAGVEEAVFRGFVLTELDRSGVSRRAQVLASGVTFGLIHAGFGWWGMAVTFLLGLGLGGLYLTGRRSLTPPILCHGLINLAVEPGLLLYTIETYARMVVEAPP
jgi:membrane protease YdiL (CAAX protease family)